MSETDPMIKVYEQWAKKKKWTLDEAWSLFCGRDPEIKITPSDFIRDGTNIYAGGIFGSNHDGVALDYTAPEHIKREIGRDIINGTISSSRDEKQFFDAKRIVMRLMTHCREEPPKELLDTLGIHKDEAEKAQPISVSKLESAYTAYISECEKDGLLPTWKENQEAMTIKLGKKPTDKSIKQIRAKLAPESWRQRGRRKSS